MSVMIARDDSSVRKKSSTTPTVMMIGASSSVSNLRQKLEVFDEPHYNGRIYFMPDVWLWRSIAKRSSRLFGIIFGWQIRRFSEVVRRDYPRNCKVVLMIHKDSVPDVVCAVAKKLVQQGEIQEAEISILIVPSPTRCKIGVNDVRRIARSHGLPWDISVEKVER